MRRNPTFLISSAVLLAMATGCAGRGATLTGLGVMKAVTQESREITFNAFYAIEENQKLVLAGALKRRDGLHSSYGGHVDVAVMDAAGKTLASASVNLNPRITRRARESYFKAAFDLKPPTGGQVFAAFHVPDKQFDEMQFDCGDNRALLGQDHD